MKLMCEETLVLLNKMSLYQWQEYLSGTFIPKTPAIFIVVRGNFNKYLLNTHGAHLLLCRCLFNEG